MRALVVLALLIVEGRALAEAEHYEQIRVDAGMTASTVSVNDRSGAGVVAEIKAMVQDHLAIGGRVEVAIMFGGAVGQDDTPLEVALAGCGLVKAEYLFGLGPVRPWLGLGGGVYTLGSQSIDSGPDARITSQTGRYLGLAPQAGVDLGRLRLAVTYNAIFGASLALHETVGGVDRVTHLSQNYLSLELSFRFGGGKKPATTSAPSSASGAPTDPAPR